MNRANDRAEALEILERVEQDGELSSAFPLALAYSRLGEVDRALKHLEQAYKNREWFMPCLRG